MRELVLAAGLVMAVLGAAGEERPVAIGAFRAIEASAGMSVVVEPGAPGATLLGNSAMFDRVIVEVRGETLVIGRKSLNFWNSGWRDQVRVRVTGPAELVRLAASSGADLTALKIAATGLDLAASSGAELTVAGSCTSLQAQASSGAELDARKLICNDAAARASSGGDLDVFVQKSASGEASSGADVAVHGPGELVKRSTSSGGDVRKVS